jgi:hypothetical protein
MLFSPGAQSSAEGQVCRCRCRGATPTATR